MVEPGNCNKIVQKIIIARIRGIDYDGFALAPVLLIQAGRVLSKYPGNMQHEGDLNMERPPEQFSLFHDSLHAHSGIQRSVNCSRVEKPRKTGTKTVTLALLNLALMCVSLTPDQLWAGTITAVDCSRSAVGNAVNSAANGDTILIPAGTCTWTTVLDGNVPGDPLYNKYLTIQGAGIDKTIILDGTSKAAYPNVPNLIRWTLIPNGLSRITGITWKGMGTTCTSTLPMLQIQGNSAQFRMDHVKVIPNGCPGTSFYGNVRGVVDHSIFDVSALASYAFYIFHSSWKNVGSYGDNSWAQPDTVGTSEALFFEDNTFVNDETKGFHYYCMDGWSGMRVVVRHNTFLACTIGNHGTESPGRPRGARQFEVYNNTWNWNMLGQAFANVIGVRSGVSVVHDNVVNTTNGTISRVFGVSNFRDAKSFAPWGQCNGTSTWDQNTSGQTGYRCIDQVGASYGDYISGDSGVQINTATGSASWPRQGSQPTYDWNNTLNGVVSDAVSDSVHIVVGRDLIHGVRPGYATYTYPHPLIAASGTTSPPPAAPTNLTIK